VSQRGDTLCAAALRDAFVASSIRMKALGGGEAASGTALDEGTVRLEVSVPGLCRRRQAKVLATSKDSDVGTESICNTSRRAGGARLV